MLAPCVLVFALVAPQHDGLYGASAAVPERTSVEIDGHRYGATPDDLGPIGGGAGYTRVVTGGDYVVRSVDALIAALAKAKPGETVFVPGEVTLDCTARVVCDGLVIELPGGVTLASDRGANGSPGALLCSDALATRPLIRVTGADARLTGLRVRGPDPERRLQHHHRAFAEGRGRDYYYRFPVSDGVAVTGDGLEVDDCELAGWSHAAIWLKRGDGHRVHHCFIHHNQYQGLGYGICHDVATSTIWCNLFDWNRHSIAGTGRPGSGYVAHDNVERGTSLSHCFDMHGGRDRKDGTNVAGTRMTIRQNTFLCARPAIVIRGEPEERVTIDDNWFVHDSPGAAIRGESRTVADTNAYRIDGPHVLVGRGD